MRQSETASTNSPLPPSVEKAYHKKCIELKKRLREIESANDAARLRKHRIDRSITKMRLERAMLLERLAKVQKRELSGAPGMPNEDSEKSMSPPPTPQERPPRSRRPRSPMYDAVGYPIINGSPPPPPRHRPTTPPPMRMSQVIPPVMGLPGPPPAIFPSGYPPPLASHPSPAAGPVGSRYIDPPPKGHIDKRGPSEIPPGEPLPKIHALPNGTNVVIIDGRPKQPPWNIKDVEPRHHIIAGFDDMPLEAQQMAIDVQQYCPYDIHGSPVNVVRDGNRYRQVFEGENDWQDPVVDNVRRDDPRVLRRKEMRERRMASTSLGTPTARDERVPAERVSSASLRGGAAASPESGREDLVRSSSGRRSASGTHRAASRRRESSHRDSGSAPGSSHGKRDGGASGSGGGGFTAVNR